MGRKEGELGGQQNYRTSTVTHFPPFPSRVPSLCARMVAQFHKTSQQQTNTQSQRKLLHNKMQKATPAKVFFFFFFAQSTRCYTTHPTQSIPSMGEGGVETSRTRSSLAPASRCFSSSLPVLESFLRHTPPPREEHRISSCQPASPHGTTLTTC